MIRNVLSSVLVTFVLFSCQKENIQPLEQPLPPQNIITDSTIVDSTLNMVGETWVITGYRVGQIGNIIETNDTLVFLTTNSYTFNGFNNVYSFYPTASSYNLILNYTTWGNLSGTIYEGNLTQGIINGLRFVDQTMGSGNQTEYYLWMKRL